MRTGDGCPGHGRRWQPRRETPYPSAGDLWLCWRPGRERCIMSDALGKVLTVLGPIEPEALGTTLIHEHIIFDLSVYFETRFGPGKAEPLPDEPLGIEHLWILKNNVARLRDNVHQRSLDIAVTELRSEERRVGKEC